jgi:LacI family transcriptional regulator
MGKLRKPTQADVARLARVSRATVSFVVNGKDGEGISISPETRMRVLEAVERLGYVVDARAQAFRSGETKTIGVYVPIYENPFFWQILQGISSEAQASGYKLLLAHGHAEERERQQVRELAEQRVDGLILATEFRLLPESIMAQLRESSHPIVEIASAPSEFDVVLQDYGAGTRALVKYLFELGHRRITFLDGVHDEVQGLDRRTAFERALDEAAVPRRNDRVVRCGPALEEGYRAAHQLLQRADRPTALIVINDLLAMAAIRAAADLGLGVPSDVSVASFDNIPFADVFVPRLTSVAGTPEQNGRDAVRLLLARLEEPRRPRATISSGWELIIRESTGPPPSSAGSRLAETGTASGGGDEMR